MSTAKERAAAMDAISSEDAKRALDAITSLQGDPVYFCEHFLGYDPWGTQRKILAALAEPQVRIAVKAAHAVGKCVRGADLAVLADGSEVRFDALVGKVFPIHTIDRSGAPLVVQAFAKWNVVEPVFRLVTESGFVVERNAAHPFWSARFNDAGHAYEERWRPLGELTASMKIAVPRELPAFGSAVAPDAMVTLLAYAAAAWRPKFAASGFFNGAFVHRDAHIAELSEIVASMGGVWRRTTLSEKAMVRAGLRSVPFGWSVDENQKQGRKRRDLAGNTVAAFLYDNGVSHQIKNMRVPRCVLGLPKEQIARFLNRFFAVCATVEPGKLTARAVSAELLGDVQRLLLRLGIRARRNQTRLWIDDCNQLDLFSERIGLFGREDELSRAFGHPDAPAYFARTLHNHETMPGLLWERVERIECVGVEQTVAVDVPHYETFLTPGAWEHNTNLAAMAAIWMTATGGITVTTAPTWHQVVRLLWKEIHATYARYKNVLGGEMFQSEWRLSPTNFAMGLSTNEGTRFQGLHADRVLVIFDEGPGVRADIWEAAEGIRAGGDVRFLAQGNPTAVGNPFYFAFQGATHNTGWKTFSIPAFATPNFAKFPDIEALERATLAELLDIPRPYLTTPRWVLEKYREWGPTSPMYAARVLAEFPSQAEDALISMSWIADAISRELATEREDYVVGIDVAGPGEDETALVCRRGGQVIHEQGWTKPDPRDEAIAVLSGFRDKAMEEKVDLRVYVDSIAIGHYFTLDIRKAGFDVTGVNVGLPPSGKDGKKAFAKLTVLPDRLLGPQEPDPGERFANLKAQLYWFLRDAFSQGNIAGELSENLQGQLAVIRYTQTDRGKIQIESKESLKSRGVSSPDRAEALMLTYYDGAPKASKGRYAPILIADDVVGWQPDDPFGLVERGRVILVS